MVMFGLLFQWINPARFTRSGWHGQFLEDFGHGAHGILELVIPGL